jgi:hypothetical protein
MSEITMNWSQLNYLVSKTIRCCYIHPVTFALIFNDIDNEEINTKLSNDNSNSEDFDDSDDSENGQLQEVSRQIDWDDVIVLVDKGKITKLTGFSEQIGNDDERGGGCGNLNLGPNEFNYTIENVNGITIRDITEIVYRLKGSKYDWWYELFSLINLTKFESGELTFEVEFDYGS